MALVVFLRGVNVGGHRTFRPSVLARQLKHLDVVNIGAAGTFVVRRRVAQARLRAELRRRLPFDTTIVICSASAVVRLLSRDPVGGRRVARRVAGGRPARPGVTRFVTVLSRTPRAVVRLPLRLPSRGPWLLKIDAREGRFVLGRYRRNMKVIGYLGTLDRRFGVPGTTRNWNTITALAGLIGARPGR